MYAALGEAYKLIPYDEKDWMGRHKRSEIIKNSRNASLRRFLYRLKPMAEERVKPQLEF